MPFSGIMCTCIFLLPEAERHRYASASALMHKEVSPYTA
jgi:hypothetical protein